MSGDILEAKRKLPLPAVLHRLGLGEHAKKSARCPFHDDGRNSFSIWPRNGVWFWKCHTGCGEGDEITFLEKHRGISRGEAIKVFLEMAAVNGASSVSLSQHLANRTNQQQPFDWQKCVEALSDTHLEQLAEWRGYSREFVSWLKDKGLIGIYDGKVAVPVHDQADKIVATHYRLKDGSWRYYPQGVKVRLLIIAELVAGEPVYSFESYLDAFSFMDISGERSGIIVTRGAGNGALVAELIPPGSTVYAWKQNDELKNGKRPADEWLKDVAAHASRKVLWSKTPEKFKDLNDWTRAGATADDLLAAMVNAEVVSEAKNDKSESTESPEATQARPFPLHCLPPVCEAMARAVCETARVKESLPGCCTLGIVSASIGAGLQVRSGANRVTRPNLYMLGSAESGSGKSEAFRHLAKPLLEFEAERVADWKEETKPGLLAEHKILEAEIANLTKSGGKPDADRDKIRGQLKAKLTTRDQIETQLRTPILSCEDVTGEKLAVLLAHNREQLASLSADALAVVNILLGRYNKLRPHR